MQAILTALTLAVLLAIPVASAQVVFFAGQVGQATIPSGYDHYFEERRKTLVLVPKAPHKVEIRFTFHSLREYVKQRPTVGKDFVTDAAKKKGKQVFPVHENGGIGFIDFDEVRNAGNEKLHSTHGMMGLSDAYVTFTLTTSVENANSDFVKTLLPKGIEVILGRIKSNAG